MNALERFQRGPLMYSQPHNQGGGVKYLESKFDSTHYPWLLAILESHRQQHVPQRHFLQFQCPRDEAILCGECKEVVADLQKDLKGKQKVGIIGFGNFGRFMARHLYEAFHDVMVTDIVEQADQLSHIGLSWGSLEEVARREIVVLAVPYEYLEDLLKTIASQLQPGTLVVDVCSVKLNPIRLMQENLPATVDIMGTHPLFGPQSARDSLEGHRIVLCPVRMMRAARISKIRALLSLGYQLEIIDIDPETHDRKMAVVQALTHFIVKGLSGFKVGNSPFATTAFEKLLEVKDLLGSDSWELFATIQNGNPFAGEVRQQFIARLAEIERRLQDPAG